MCQPSWPIVLTILSALLVGCATSSIEMAPDQPDRPWVPAIKCRRRDHAPGAKASPESKQAGTTHVLPANSELAEVSSPFGLDRTRTYSLADLIDIAQSNNPLTRTAWNKAREATLAAGISKKALIFPGLQPPPLVVTS